MSGGRSVAPATRIDYDKFHRLLKDLEEQCVNYWNPAILHPPFDQEGFAESVIQRFETCYDCLWTVLKRYLLEVLGLPAPPNGPKPIFRLAHQNRLFRAPVEQWRLYADRRNANANANANVHDCDYEKAKCSLEVRASLIDAVGLYQTMSGNPWE